MAFTPPLALFLLFLLDATLAYAASAYYTIDFRSLSFSVSPSLYRLFLLSEFAMPISLAGVEKKN